MKVAITIWGNRISPVFDAAKTLLIADIQKNNLHKKEYHSFNPHVIPTLISTLNQQRVSTLVCGAISTHPADQIVSHDIKLISFVMGNALDFLESFMHKKQVEKSFIMPGCDLDITSGSTSKQSRF